MGHRMLNLSRPRVCSIAPVLLALLSLLPPAVVSADNTNQEFIPGGDKIDGFGLPKGWLKHICPDANNVRLNNTDEVNKAASAVGTTMMALLPALITFGALPTAPLRELLYLSPVAAFWTALMRLGLPMVKIPLLLSADRIIKTSELFDDRTLVQTLGTVASPADMPDLASWYDESLSEGLSGPHAAAGPELLHLLRERVLRPRQRWSLRKILMLVIGFTVLQEGVFVILTEGLAGIAALDIIWLCPSESIKALDVGWSSAYFYNMWLYVACLLPVLPMLYAKSSHREPQEIFQLSDPGPVAADTGCSQCSVEHTIPPNTKPKNKTPSAWGIFFWRKRTHRPGPTTPSTSSWQFLKRPQPVVVVIRLSDEVNDPVRKLFTSILEGVFGAFMLILLTFLFGSVYGGQLFFILAFLVAFTATIIFSRVASISFYIWAQRATQLTLIECGSVEEMRGMARVLCAMPGVLIQSRNYNYSYLGGRRLGCDHVLPATGSKSYAKRKHMVRVVGFIGFLAPFAVLVFPTWAIVKFTPATDTNLLQMGTMLYVFGFVVIILSLAMPVTVGYMLLHESADRVGLRWQHQQPGTLNEARGNETELATIDPSKGKEQTLGVDVRTADGDNQSLLHGARDEESGVSSSHSFLMQPPE